MNETEAKRVCSGLHQMHLVDVSDVSMKRDERVEEYYVQFTFTKSKTLKIYYNSLLELWYVLEFQKNIPKELIY